MSRPWHGPYWVRTCNSTNITATKVYFPQERLVHVHLNCVKPCPIGFTPGYYWYGGRRCGPGRPPKWVEAIITEEGPDTDKGTEPAEALHSLTDDSLVETPFPESDQHLAEDVTAEREDVSSTRTQPDTTKAVGNDSLQAPTRYSLRTSRRPPERYN